VKKPEDYLLFLGRFTEGKGVLQAIEIAKRLGIKLILAAAEDEYYRERVAPHVDGRHIVYYGEADFDAKVKLYGAARALLYPFRRASRSASCSPRRWRAGRRWISLNKHKNKKIKTKTQKHKKKNKNETPGTKQTKKQNRMDVWKTQTTTTKT